MNIISVAIGGFIGAILRIESGEFLLSQYPEAFFPYPTLIINLFGAFILALFLGYTDLKSKFPNPVKLGVSTGMLGAFTTFSTFSIEALQLFQGDKIAMAVLYIIFSFIGGFFSTWLGMETVNRIFRSRTRKRSEW